jgi:hypothetical protein
MHGEELMTHRHKKRTTHADHVKKLALQLTYDSHVDKNDPALWKALQRAAPSLAGEIEAAWLLHKPCFYWWMHNDVSRVDPKQCACRGKCDEVPTT